MTARTEDDLLLRKDFGLRRKVLPRFRVTTNRTQLHQHTRLFSVRLVYELPELEPLKAVTLLVCETDNDSTSSARAAEGRRVGESQWTLPLCILWLPSSSQRSSFCPATRRRRCRPKFTGAPNRHPGAVLPPSLSGAGCI